LDEAVLANACCQRLNRQGFVKILPHAGIMLRPAQLYRVWV
jgi:hypothetical protein